MNTVQAQIGPKKAERRGCTPFQTPAAQLRLGGDMTALMVETPGPTQTNLNLHPFRFSVHIIPIHIILSLPSNWIKTLATVCTMTDGVFLMSLHCSLSLETQP